MMNLNTGFLFELGGYVSKAAQALTDADMQDLGKVDAIHSGFIQNLPVGIGTNCPVNIGLGGSIAIGGLVGIITEIPNTAVGWISRIIDDRNKWNKEYQQYIYQKQIVEIGKYIKTLNVTQSDWTKMGLEEKKMLLQTIEDKVAGIQERDPIALSWFDTEDDRYKAITPKIGFEISINNDHLKDSFADVLKSLFHEERHIYQRDLFRHPLREHDPTEYFRWLWANLTYSEDPTKDKEKYLKNILEADAREYSENVVKQITKT